MWTPIWRPMAALLPLVMLAALSDAALLNRDEFLYDGKTTYCYWVNQGMSVVSLDYSYVKIEGKNLECPMTLTVTQSSAGPIRPRQDVEYLFTAKLNLNDNRFGMKGLEATIPDPTTGRPVHIGHANIHTCSITTACDVFRNGANRKISDQETSNFTDDSATFRQRIAFDREGEYNVFAHLVLPPKNPFNESYHFVVFTTTKVISTDASTSKGADSTGMPTATIVGLVVGSIVLIIGVVAAVMFRRRRQPGLPYGNDHFRHSARLSGKTQRDTHPAKPTPSAGTGSRVAVSPPRHWSVRAARGFVEVFPSAPAPRSPRQSASTVPPTKVTKAATKSSLKWKEIERFDPTMMKQLVDVAYGIRRTEDGAQSLEDDVLGLSSMDEPRRREAERRLVRDQVYLPSVHRTLNFLHKARQRQQHAQLEKTPTANKEPQGPQPIVSRTAPLSVNLLSDQLGVLQEELIEQLAAEHAPPSVYGTHVWLPQPPEALRGGSTRSSNSSIRSRRVQQTGSTSSTSLSQNEEGSEELQASAELYYQSTSGDCSVDSDPHNDGDATDDESASMSSCQASTISSGAAGDDEASWPTPAIYETHTQVKSHGSSWDSLETHVLQVLEPISAVEPPALVLPLETEDVRYDSEDLALFADGASDSGRSAVDLQPIEAIEAHLGYETKCQTPLCQEQLHHLEEPEAVEGQVGSDTPVLTPPLDGIDSMAASDTIESEVTEKKCDAMPLYQEQLHHLEEPEAVKGQVGLETPVLAPPLDAIGATKVSEAKENEVLEEQCDAMPLYQDEQHHTAGIEEPKAVEGHGSDTAVLAVALDRFDTTKGSEALENEVSVHGKDKLQIENDQLSEGDTHEETPSLQSTVAPDQAAGVADADRDSKGPLHDSGPAIAIESLEPSVFETTDEYDADFDDADAVPIDDIDGYSDETFSDD
ncbi:hypothetical protein ATCC90586_006612 [Pythium insidiosum]|nr:hypothetical protein ATCC90586_006612 [Pythium insidiosum]